MLSQIFQVLNSTREFDATGSISVHFCKCGLTETDFFIFFKCPFLNRGRVRWWSSDNSALRIEQAQASQ